MIDNKPHRVGVVRKSSGQLGSVRHIVIQRRPRHCLFPYGLLCNLNIYRVDEINWEAKRPPCKSCLAKLKRDAAKIAEDAENLKGETR